ncbi:hypothetical protein [Saccharomonospora iraqiensis]|uniref:hypothetical protein n=1 Tax=Saccharomonospora iraqiensis TaxID=52698 RepID=UPI000415FD93|nr:hypothetical protein [Saccharomonospora iraqiensis]
MVHQEREQRGSEYEGTEPQPGHLTGSQEKFAASAPTGARRRAGRKLFEHQAELDAEWHRRVAPPAVRRRVEELMGARWGEPVLVLRLDGNAKLAFDVPGRRTDGTVRGKKLVRRFFVTIAHGIGLAVAAFLALSSGNGLGNGGRKNASATKPVHVQGPADARALDMVDTFRRAEGAWLVCSPSHLALVDTGSPLRDPADAPEPEIVWEGRRPHLPEIRLRTRSLLWSDGSRFTFPLAGRPEERHLRDHLTQPGTAANN